MLKKRATVIKTLSFDRGTAQTVERLARQEGRSFTKQVEILLKNALQRPADKQPEQVEVSA